ncbi:NADH-quinone oxidoreductase subunit A [Deltaproteobacteria bacterium Smac51]|nr:NADH-quinone oxidoreductase subunit A [Deltaproteobacteria bacterium Smac51]
MVFDTLHLAIILFLVVGFLFPVAPIILGFILAPRTSGGDFLMPYECGMVPHGRAWGHFGMNYYIYALIFIAFDVDVLYLFPISVYYGQSTGWLAFIELTYFLFFVVLAIVYFKAKGVFDWPRKINVHSES